MEGERYSAGQNNSRGLMVFIFVFLVPGLKDKNLLVGPELLQAVDRGYVRMIQRRENHRLSLESS